MSEYEKVLKSGHILAKRGCCYFLYPSIEHLKADDEAEALNINRMNAGEPVVNRCYSCNMYGYTRKLRDAIAYDETIAEALIPTVFRY